MTPQVTPDVLVALLRKVWVHARTSPVCGACLSRAGQPHDEDCELEALQADVERALAAPQAPALDHEALVEHVDALAAQLANSGAFTGLTPGWMHKVRPILLAALRAAPRAPASPQETARGCICPQDGATCWTCGGTPSIHCKPPSSTSGAPR